MLKLLKQVIAGEVSPVEIIKGDNEPTMILVDLVCSKILMNLDNIDFKVKEVDLQSGYNGNIAFTWKVDDIVVAGSKTLVVERINNSSGYRINRVYSKDYFDIEPNLRVHGKKHELKQKEQVRLWETMENAGFMKIERDKQKAEYDRQRLAVEAIANMGGRESDLVKKAKELSEQAMLRISPPTKIGEEALLERFGEEINSQ